MRHLTELSDIVFCGDGEDTFSPGAMVTQIKSKIRNIVQSNYIYTPKSSNTIQQQLSRFSFLIFFYFIIEFSL